ncbi:MAG TPA: amidohydrolase family protein [Candidatus Binataceae bacterium]|nr:amidohydrolase family protein [Candidatus Binataceae bacterium]
MPRFDTVIKHGMIIDGTRAPRYCGDIGVKDGRISEIGELAASDGRREIDASGLIVAPGFVDLHTHYDAQVFWDPYCSISGWHGVTTAAIGNCGFGFAPVRSEQRERAMLTMTRVEAIPYASMKAGLPWDWVTFPQFLDSLERRPKGVNLQACVPLSPLITWVMGSPEEAKQRTPTAAEEREIVRLFNQAMDAGACGWSAQRLHPAGPVCLQRDYDGTPMVTDVMGDEICRTLARELSRRNAGFIQLSMATADPFHDLKEIETLAELSRRPLLYQALLSFDREPQIHRFLIAWFEHCHANGLRIYPQAHTNTTSFTFTLADWNLFDDSEAWREATLGSSQERLKKLSDPRRRAALKDYANGQRLVTGDLENFVIQKVYSPRFEHLQGLTLKDAGGKMEMHIVDAMLEIAIADELRTVFDAPPPHTRLDLLKEVVNYPYTIPGLSDGGAHTKFYCGGRYPTEFLASFIRDHNMLSLEEAHWKLSAWPAMCAGLADRGVLREGHAADIVIYDYDCLGMEPSKVVHDLPGGEWRRVQRARGYRYIMVNGEVTFLDGEPTELTPGLLLRQGSNSTKPQLRHAS